MLNLLGKLLQSKTHAAPAPAPFNVIYAEATAAASRRELARAVELYDRAIAFEPRHAEAHYRRGNALKDLGRLEAAIASYDRAIECKPDYAYAYCNRGVVQRSLGHADAALSSFDQAIAADPGDAIAHCNRAQSLQDHSRWEEAIASYDRALALEPQFSDAHYNRALTLLFLGDFERGWRGFEWRWQNAERLAIGNRRNFRQPLWLGDESLQGKTILLYSEGGLGDTLQFCRYAARVAALGAQVCLEVQPPLVELLARLDGASRVLAAGEPLPDFDYQCPLMSLPLALQTSRATIPTPEKYLLADRGRIDHWRVRLRERTRPHIGLVWSGNPGNRLDRQRSIRLADWAPHLPPQFDYFCLQRDVRPEDQAALDSRASLTCFERDCLDFENTAALCECMDLVISVDTSIAHLSAALGRTTWLMLPVTPDWRWMRGDATSPWYSTMTLYRQAVAGEWREVFSRVGADLLHRFAAG